MEILSYKEEQKLNKEEREKYLGELREFCKKRKLTNTTKGATTIAPKLKIPKETIARIVTRAMAGGEVEVVVDGVENIEKVGGQYCLHQRIRECWMDLFGCRIVRFTHCCFTALK